MQAGNHALAENDVTHAMSAFEQAHTLKPGAAEALQGEAGVWMLQNQPQKALPLFEQAVRMQEDRPQGWTAWFDALVQSDRSKEVIADQPYISPDTRAKLETDADYMAVMAAAQMNVGNEVEARRLMTELEQVSLPEKRTEAQVRCAELLAI